jgi:hypothetical protein
MVNRSLQTFLPKGLVMDKEPEPQERYHEYILRMLREERENNSK